VKWFQKSVGIDPSGARLAVVAVQGGLGGPSVVRPPLCHEYRGDREGARLEEAEAVLGEYVARNALVGAEAFLVLPAERVHTARAAFPPLREKDLREAVGMELERLFPVSPATLRYGYRRLPDVHSAGRIPLAVAAVSTDYLNRFEEILSRAGLSLAAAIPAGWAAGAAVSRLATAPPAEPGAASVLLRWLGDSVECTVLAGGEALFCASRACTPEAAPDEGMSLALAGITDLPDPPEDTGAALMAPAGWFPIGEFRPGGSSVSFRVHEGFPGKMPAASGIGSPGAPEDPLPFLCAFGAAVAGRDMDLLAPQRSGEMSRATRAILAASAASALCLGVAWPATVGWRAKTEIRRLDERVVALRPFAQEYEETLSDLDEAQARFSVLQEEASASGETLRILKELTDRLPNGTWVLTLRIDGRKVDMEGLSPSASEIFPALTRDGRFRSVEFGAPITRQADNIERFKIRGEYVPTSPAEAPAPLPLPGGKR